MKSLFVAAALVAVTAAPVLAGPMDEIARDLNTPVQVVQAPAYETGAGDIVNSEIDGADAPSRIDSLRVVSRPAAERPNHGGGR